MNSDEMITKAQYVNLLVKELGPQSEKYRKIYTKFKADQSLIVREEVAYINTSVLECKFGKKFRFGNLNQLKDWNLISPWAREYVQVARALKIVTSAHQLLFGPEDHVSYQSAVSLLKRVHEIFLNQEPELIVDLPDIQLLMDLHIRDTSICLGGDGAYYLTGSTGEDIWDHNDGIELWRSTDLKNWDSIGLVWSIERDGTYWHRKWNIHHGRPIRSIWAPEVHYLRGTYWLAYSMPLKGTGLLKSSTGNPEGPYISAVPYEKPLTNGIDASLFQDDDGNVYFIYDGSHIARMNADMSGLIEEPKQMLATPPDLNPAHHGPHKNGKLDDIGSEGGFLFKREGKYYLSCADWYSTAQRYSSMIAVSDSIYGPYTLRHEAVPCGGHNTFFKDKEGKWWSTFFGNDCYAPFREKPAIVPIRFTKEGKVQIN